MAAVERVLEQLARVRQTGPTTWWACCPAHEDKNPSLRLKLGQDECVLVKCWAGCKTEAVLEALGMSWQDLFEPRTPLASGLPRPKSRSRVSESSSRQNDQDRAAIEDAHDFGLMTEYEYESALIRWSQANPRVPVMFDRHGEFTDQITLRSQA